MPTAPTPQRTSSSELLNQGSNKSSDYLGLSEPPEASKTPDPSTLFPLMRRSSSNYQTALLGDKLGKVNFNKLNITHGKNKQHESAVEADPLAENELFKNAKRPTDESHIQQYSPSGKKNDNVNSDDWTPEGSKRDLQRRSTGLNNTTIVSDKSFNVQYRGSFSHPPQSTERETAPELYHRESVPRSYHSNQQSPVDEGHDQKNYFPRSFEYADFKRRMSKN